MEINTQTISNHLDNSNKFSIDWNQLGCIAFASGNVINIIDSDLMKIIKTISPANPTRVSSITKLKWSPINQNNNGYPHLASAVDDIISIWNPNEAKLIQELIPNETSSSSIKINDMKWILNSPGLNKTNNLNILITIYSNNKLIIWNPQYASKLWSKNLNDSLNHLTIDPHDFLRVALLGTNFVQFLKIDFENDFKEKSQRKFYLTSNEANATETNQLLSSESRKSSINLFTSYWKNIKPLEAAKSPILSGSQKPLSTNECFQLEFHSMFKNLLFLVYSKEIFLLDLNLNQTISFIQLDKIYSPFIQIYSCSQSDVLFSLHENGSITVHSRNDSTNNYSLAAQSDQIRLAKNTLVFGFSVCPNSQKNISVLLSDGRVLKYELFQKKSLIVSKFLFEFDNKIKNCKLMLTSMLNVMPTSLFVLKIGPALTKKNCKIWQPLLAIGDSNGYLFVYNLNKNKLTKKMMLYTYAVLGIEWCSLNSIITWSYNINSSLNSLESPASGTQTRTLVKNEILFTDLRTGESINFRSSVPEESPIISAKLSNLRQYLVLLFRDQPLEIWDMKNFSMIKKISKKSPIISVLEWCPHDFNKKQDFNKLTVESKRDLNQPEPTSETLNLYKQELNTHDSKESFICIDSNGLMYSFSVEANHIKDGAIQLPEDGALLNIQCIALKKDLILFGDLDGNITKWDIKTKQSKTIQLKKGIDVKKIKFAPGKENLLLLVQFVDSIQILEVNNLDIFSDFKTNKVKILDTYWCSSDKLILYFNDLSIKIYNINFKQIYDYPIDCLAPCFYKSLLSCDKKEKNLIKFKSSVFNLIDRNAFNELVSNENLNDGLKELLNNKIENNFKIEKFALFSSYFNLNSFETKFWSLFASILNNDDKFNYLFKQNSFLIKSDLFKLNELDQLKALKEKSFDFNNQSNGLLRDFLFFNELDFVFNLLMETDSSSENYTNNLIKACLISTIKNSNDISQTQTSIKLVATNLIANGKLYDGIELLCLIGLVFDACRYLQDNNEWEKAAWLAKIRLSEDEQNDVVKRWSENLCSNRKELAILLLLSCKLYWKALDVLSDTIHFQIAYLFMKYLIESKLINLGFEFQLEEKQEELFISHLLKNIDSINLPQNQKIVKKILENYLDFKSSLDF